MVLSDKRLIVRLNGPFLGPLKDFDRAQRKVIAQSVSRGRAVENHADAATAIAFALWLMRWYGWAAIGFAVLGVLNIVVGALGSVWVSFAIGLVFVGMAALYLWLRVRLRRSVSLNEAIA